MFFLVLLSFVLAHDNASSSNPVVVGRYASIDACKDAANHSVWVNAHGADNARFGFVCVEGGASMRPAMQVGAPPQMAPPDKK